MNTMSGTEHDTGVAPSARIERGVSTWSLHRTLGEFAGAESAVHGGPFLPQVGAAPKQTLIDLLPELAARGYTTLHICHFHLESRDLAYLRAVRNSLERQGISLDTLLIDDGDLTAPDRDVQLAWYDGWLEAAAALGARRARIGAGRSAPTEELLRSSGQSLAALAARHPTVRVVTENWLGMTPDAESIFAVLEAAGDQIGLLIDLGNWHGPHKHAELAKIAAKAETCHAKCAVSAAGPDEADFGAALTVLRDAGFAGPLALIYDGPDPDEWYWLDREWEIVQRVFA